MLGREVDQASAEPGLGPCRVTVRVRRRVGCAQGQQAQARASAQAAVDRELTDAGC